MKQFILVLRGASGSGKTVITNEIQEIIGSKVAHLRADYFYWKVCPQDENKNVDNNPIVYKNLKSLAQNYTGTGYSVVIEGLLNKIDDFGLQKDLLDLKNKHNIIYKRVYLEVNLETAKARNSKGKSFVDDEDMKKWIIEGGKSITSDDIVIDTKSQTPKQLAEMIIGKLSSVK